MPFRTRRFIIEMAVHCYLNSDFSFTPPIKFKCNFIDFALHLLLNERKKASHYQRAAFRLVFHPESLLVFFNLVEHLTQKSSAACQPSKSYTLLKRSIKHPTHYHPRQSPFCTPLSSRERFSLDGRKVISFAELRCTIGAKQEPHTLAYSTAFLSHVLLQLQPKIPTSLSCACRAAQKCGVMGGI